MANDVTVDPRYLGYDKEDVEALLRKVEHPDIAPTAESDELVTSGGVKAAIDSAKALIPKLETNDDPASLLTEENANGEDE